MQAVNHLWDELSVSNCGIEPLLAAHQRIWGSGRGGRIRTRDLRFWSSFPAMISRVESYLSVLIRI